MQLRTILFALLVAIGSTSGATLPYIGEESNDLQRSLSKLPPFTHLSVSSDLTCENFVPGARLAMLVKADGKREQMMVPPQMEQIVRTLCPRFQFKGRSEPLDLKVEITVVDQMNGKPIMSFEMKVHNGCATLVSGPVLLLALLLHFLIKTD